MLSLQRTGRGAPLFVLLVLLLACSRPPLTEEEEQNLIRTAAYARQVEGIRRQFDDLIMRTLAYQELARAVRDRKMAPTTAGLQGRGLSAELRPEFDRLSAALAGKARIPDGLGTEDQRDRLRTVIAVAGEYRDWSRGFIEAGEDLLADAIAGDFAGIINTDIERVRFYSWKLDRQLLLLDEELAAMDDGYPFYYLTAAQKSQVQALRAMMAARSAVHGPAGEPGAVAEQKGRAVRWIRRGFERVEDGRKILPETLRGFRSPEAARQIGAARQQIMIDLLLDNFPKALDVEARILRELEGSIDRVFGPGADSPVFDAAALSDLVARLNGLSEERARLQAERQLRASSPGAR